MAIPIFQPQDNPTRTNFNARIEAANDALAEKQEKLTGTPGQVVGFNSAGEPVAQDAEDAGVDGKSAYEYAVDGGYPGTEEEFATLIGSGPWLPMTGGTIDGFVHATDFLSTDGSVACGLVQCKNINMHSTDYPTISFKNLTFDGEYIEFRKLIEGTQTYAPVPVVGIATPCASSAAANKQYVDNAIASLKQYVDEAIASIGPAEPSGAFAFSISDNGHLVCSYTGSSPPEFQISDNGHLIYSYTGDEPPGYYINENGHLCLDIEEVA